MKDQKKLQRKYTNRFFMKKMWNLFLLKLKFAFSGLVGTSADYIVYLLLVHKLFHPAPSNVISYSLAMIINFSLQKKYVFSLQGSVSRTFIMSVIVSVGGLLLSTLIVWGLTLIPFYFERQYFTKLIATGLVFFYNFYVKRYIFESWI